MSTGDLGVIDEDGWASIGGRLNDVLIRKGENQSATEIEDLPFAHPKVADIAVGGLPDPTSGERACAVVVPRPSTASLSLPETVRYLRDAGLSKHKIPEQLDLVGPRARSASGKVLQREQRAKYS